MTRTKKEIIAQITGLGFSKKQSADFFKTFLEIMKRRFENGEDVLASGFGKFQVKDKKTTDRPESSN